MTAIVMPPPLLELEVEERSLQPVAATANASVAAIASARLTIGIMEISLGKFGERVWM
jgi:hypothetical protein